MAFRVVVMGAPASGKSTLTRRIVAEHAGMASFAVRRYFADQIQHQTQLGRTAKPFADGGGWLPDTLVVAALRQEVAAGRFGSGFVLEGVPATVSQAILLDRFLEAAALPLTAIIHLDAPDEACLYRSARRTVCNRCDHGSAQAVPDERRPDRCGRCGGPIVRRVNDTVDLMSGRLTLHRTNIGPVLDYYRGDARLIQVDGRFSADAVYDATMSAIRGRLGVG